MLGTIRRFNGQTGFIETALGQKLFFSADEVVGHEKPRAGLRANFDRDLSSSQRAQFVAVNVRVLPPRKK